MGEEWTDAKYVHWERHLIGEWVTKTYPDAEVRFRVQIGTPPVTPEGAVVTASRIRMLQVYCNRADAIVFLPDRLVLIEASIVASPSAVTQLELYREMLPTTPDLAPWRHLPIEAILLYAIEHPTLLRMTRGKGIRTVQYVPKWLDKWLKKRGATKADSKTIGRL